MIACRAFACDRELLGAIRAPFALDWKGIHGAPHWARVWENGRRLSESTGANVRVVELFAVFHDSRGLNEGHDPEHGLRAAESAESLAGTVFELAPPDLELLLTACRGHSEGRTDGDITLLTCWDADRLDLGRVGVRPHPGRLCTEPARDPAMLEWAYRTSVKVARGRGSP